ncbi:MAG TPA: endolytic transglycosylase MltG [Gemmatimonadales bacterium]|nr:endolytic transglycosylase MltG [Gemmatimonadales bacterium]
MARVTIPPRATVRVAAESLAAHGIVRSRLWFRVLARIRGVDRSIQAGVYEFPRNAPIGDVMAALASGRTATARLTLPEGLAIPDIAALVAQRLGVSADSVIAAARDPALADSLQLPGRSLEGFLFPETYAVPIATPAREIVRTLAESFKAAWRPEWSARLDTLRWSQLEAVTLASIVEGEARADDERAIIAGVYHNRLRIGMALQADPTVQYALLLATGQRKPRLYSKDYRFPHPYNTYLRPGLPPGPVNSPGRRSLEATLYPAKVPFLYFVAMPDGRHRFAATYDEHLRNVAASRRAWRGVRSSEQ